MYFLILALVTTMLCAFLNLLSLAFGIPAIILAALVLILSLGHANLISCSTDPTDPIFC